MVENNKKIYTSTVIIFWISIALVFLVSITLFILGGPFDEKYIIFINIPIQTVYAILGIALIVLAAKGKFTGISKAFFMLTGASLVGACLGYLLSNFVFAKFIEEPSAILGGEIFAVIFIVAFLAGMIGSIVLLAKKKVIIQEISKK